ncbi:MAG: preprotein translocase subunit YajC [Endomicrobium sp.]|jgi:preprotein translocase subunit YajC|nr:preprotein translocase subunit YajC [Endomicrobium sp.]
MSKVILILFYLYLLNPSIAFANSSNDSFAIIKLLPLVFVFLFFYLFIFRPQYKKTKEHKKLLNSLKKGDTIITIGGLYAKVITIQGSIINAKIADKVYVNIAKQAISVVIQDMNHNPHHTTTK